MDELLTLLNDAGNLRAPSFREPGQYAALGGVVFYLMEPKIFNSLFLNIEKYFNYFYDLIIVPIINFITTV